MRLFLFSLAQIENKVKKKSKHSFIGLNQSKHSFIGIFLNNANFKTYFKYMPLLKLFSRIMFGMFGK